MQFIRLPKPVDIAGRVLPELVVDWVDTYSVQSINIIVLQQLGVNMLVSWVIEWSKSSMPHRRTFKNFTHRAWAMWDLSNHDFFRIIPTQAPNRGKHCCWDPSAQSHFKPGPVMSRWLSRDSTVPTTECHASSMLSAPFGGHGISPTRI